MTTDEAITAISEATGPGDLFGDGAPGYRELARVLLHPDASPRSAAAAAAFRRLGELRAAHEAGESGLAFRGDIANLYRAGPGLLDKMPRDPADGDLIRAEAHALRTLAARAPEKTRAFYPELVAAARRRDPATGVTRQVNTLRELDGFVTLAAVQAACPGGVNPRDAAWMWRRLLFALGGACRAGLVHGAVLPPHVMIHPAEHGLVLADWCYSGPGPRHRLRAVPRTWKHWYPAAVLSGTPAGAGLDIRMAAACMTDLTGPAGMPRQLRAFAQGCRLAGPDADAWNILDDLDDLIGRLWGPRAFRLFALPATGATTTGRTP